MNDPIHFPVQTDLTKCKMWEVVIQAAEPASTREATDRVVKIIHSTYAKDDLDKISEAEFQLDKDKRKQLSGIII